VKKHRHIKTVLLLIGFMLAIHFAHAQQPKAPRIGFLVGTKPAAVAARVAAFQRGLREMGYVEGKNIAVEYRYAEGNADRERELASELVRLKVDVIVTTGPTLTRAAKRATVMIPIVMAQDGDPVASGFVASLARPGGNITGLASLAPEINGKRLELLKEIIPKLSRVAVIGVSTEPGYAQFLKEMEFAAVALKLTVQYLDVLTSKDIESAFRAAVKERADGVVMLGSQIFNTHRIQIVELAVKSRLPATYPRPEYVEDGGLMTYGPSINDLFQRAATYVDKILKGAKPADLSVEQPTRFEFIINLKAAKLIDLTIPQKVLARADRVIR
jgi:putative ABC transport system substrate-binding protein